MLKDWKYYSNIRHEGGLLNQCVWDQFPNEPVLATFPRWYLCPLNIETHCISPVAKSGGKTLFSQLSRDERITFSDYFLEENYLFHTPPLNTNAKNNFNAISHYSSSKEWELFASETILFHGSVLLKVWFIKLYSSKNRL